MAQGVSQGQRRPSGIGQKLTHDDYDKILDYIDNRENFDALHGAGGKTKIGGKNQSRKTTFAVMAAVLSAHGFPDVSGENSGKRYSRYHEMYRKAVIVKQSSGGGLTEEEFRAGITLSSKLEKMCPHFERMDSIFGMRSNVNPAAESSGGVRGFSTEVEDAIDTQSPPEDNEADEGDLNARAEEVPTPRPQAHQRSSTPNNGTNAGAAAMQGAAPPSQQSQGSGANGKRKKKIDVLHRKAVWQHCIMRNAHRNHCIGGSSLAARTSGSELK